MFQIAYHPIYKHPLPDGHRFPMIKYDLLPQQLLHEGTAQQTDFFEPSPVQLEQVYRVHDKKYVEQLLQLSLDAKAARKIGFPLSETLVQRELIIAGGSVKGSEMALKTGIAFNIAGGTHHAYSNRGEAFCLLNDQAIAAQYLLDGKWAKKILIIDLDVHQGNGTAEIFRKESRVYTLSIHGATNYPFKKEQSDYDIALADGTNDEKYLSIISEIIPKKINQERPDFVFYLSGVDILATDKLGKLGCSLIGCKKRDEIVLEWCQKLQIPVQVSMGGGYSPEIKTIIEAHANTYRVAREIFS